MLANQLGNDHHEFCDTFDSDRPKGKGWRLINTNVFVTADDGYFGAWFWARHRKDAEQETPATDHDAGAEALRLIEALARAELACEDWSDRLHATVNDAEYEAIDKEWDGLREVRVAAVAALQEFGTARIKETA